MGAPAAGDWSGVDGVAPDAGVVVLPRRSEPVLSPELVLVSPPEVARAARLALPDPAGAEVIAFAAGYARPEKLPVHVPDEAARPEAEPERLRARYRSVALSLFALAGVAGPIVFALFGRG